MISTDLQKNIKDFFKGEVLIDEPTLKKYSRDASLFEVKPTLVAFPKNSDDVQNLVNFINENRKTYAGLSITGRAAGTDMSGGSIGEGIILDFTKYFKKEEVDLEEMKATVGPGVYFRDFEKETLPEGVSMPVYPASKALAALGGMIMNNCGGEKTLRYGQIRNFVKRLKMVLANGREYSFRKLTMEELNSKMEQTDFEGEIYKKTFELIDTNYDAIQRAKPQTSKNSSGYALWDVYNKKEGTFDLTQLFTGSQGTLGILIEGELGLVKVKKHEKLVSLFFKDWDELPEVVKRILPIKPESMETFDDTTMKLGIRFMPEIAKKVGKNVFSFAKQFLPEVILGIKMLGMPKLIVLVQVTEDTEYEVDEKVDKILESLKGMKVWHRVIDTPEEAEKYWVMRRESFNLLRNHVKSKKTAPFIDDFCVLPEKLPEFLPRLLGILKMHEIKVNIAGHAGSGNLHIIPLMDLSKESERAKIPKVSDEVYDLIIQYGGTITAEHNDGIIRTPYVEKMFGTQIYDLFKKVKEIFDPNNIFNPGKKVGGSLQYLKDHISRE